MKNNSMNFDVLIANPYIHRNLIIYTNQYIINAYKNKIMYIKENSNKCLYFYKNRHYYIISLYKNLINIVIVYNTRYKKIDYIYSYIYNNIYSYKYNLFIVNKHYKNIITKSYYTNYIMPSRATNIYDIPGIKSINLSRLYHINLFI